MLTDNDILALALSLKLAAVTVIMLLAIGTPIAWWLSVSRWRYKFLLEAIIALPLILPPTVLGFYLLIALGPNGPLGAFANALFGKPLAFSFAGLVFGSVIYSLPFVIQPLQNAFAAIGKRPMEVAATLRASPIDRFFTIAVPLALPGFITAAVLGFAHTIGEFGVVLMIGGNIPGKTQVLSIAVYEHVETLDFARAHIISAGLLIASFLMLAAVYAFNRRVFMVRP